MLQVGATEMDGWVDGIWTVSVYFQNYSDLLDKSFVKNGRKQHCVRTKLVGFHRKCVSVHDTLHSM
jgi:hypothetical protein